MADSEKEIIGRKKRSFKEWLICNTADDAPALLKEQEPKRMRLCNGELCCPQCGAICKSYYHYCDECGQAVKWDE